MIFTKNDNNDIFKVGCSHTYIIDIIINDFFIHQPFKCTEYKEYFANTIAFFKEMWITEI